MSYPKFETLLYSVEDGIATITLNRPENLNAFNGQMAADLQSVFDYTDADDAVKAVIVTGSGTRAFCSGADLSGGGFSARAQEAAAAQSGPLVPNRDGAGLVTLRIFDSVKPIIAAVNAASVGVGVTMQLPMDFRMGSTAARFSFAFVKRGIVPEGASTYFLPRLVGMPKALEWCYSGRFVPAEEALKFGLLQSVHEPHELLPAAREFAKSLISSSAPQSIAMTRRMAWRMTGATHPMQAHQAESMALHYRFRSGDASEGVQAFLQKREPTYPDKTSDMPDIFPKWMQPKFEDGF
ncbi:MAG: crotonase/enoyl-CoA hydratase family protein [Caulobacterales bacterium]